MTSFSTSFLHRLTLLRLASQTTATQLPNVPFLTPRSRATVSMGFLVSRSQWNFRSSKMASRRCRHSQRVLVGVDGNR